MIFAEKTKEEKRRRKEEEEAKKRREEDLKRRREEEVKRRREVVGRFCKQSKVASTTSEEDDSNGGRVCAPRSRKFLNLFANSSSPYSATGGGVSEQITFTSCKLSHFWTKTSRNFAVFHVCLL